MPRHAQLCVDYCEPKSYRMPFILRHSAFAVGLYSLSLLVVVALVVLALVVELSHSTLKLATQSHGIRLQVLRHLALNPNFKGSKVNGKQISVSDQH